MDSRRKRRILTGFLAIGGALIAAMVAYYLVGKVWDYLFI